MLILTVVTVVLTVLEPNKFYKAAYLALVLLLAGIEYRAINLDHDETVLQEAQRRTEQNSLFYTILNGILTDISSGQDHFTTMMHKSNELADSSKKNLDLTRYSLNQITGGDQFCYLIPITQVGQSQWRIAVMNSGQFPLPFCHVIVHQHFNADEGLRLMQTPEGKAIVMGATEK